MRRRNHLALERILRRNRPEPRPELLRSLADEIREGIDERRYLRAPRLALAVALTAICIAALGAVGAAGSATNAVIDAVRVVLSPQANVRVARNTPAQDQYQQPSIAVTNVVISSAAPGSSSVSGTFVIENESDDPISVLVTSIQLVFKSRLPGGGTQTHTATCTINPSPPTTIGPNDSQTFSFSCTLSPAVPTNAEELKVTVSAQISGRDKTFSDTGTIEF